MTHKFTLNFLCRSAVSQSRAFKISTCSANTDTKSVNDSPEQSASAPVGPEIKDQAMLQQADLSSRWRDWLRPPWSKPQRETNKMADSRLTLSSVGFLLE